MLKGFAHTRPKTFAAKYATTRKVIVAPTAISTARARRAGAMCSSPFALAIATIAPTPIRVSRMVVLNHIATKHNEATGRRLVPIAANGLDHSLACLGT